MGELMSQAMRGGPRHSAGAEVKKLFDEWMAGAQVTEDDHVIYDSRDRAGILERFSEWAVGHHLWDHPHGGYETTDTVAGLLARLALLDWDDGPVRAIVSTGRWSGPEWTDAAGVLRLGSRHAIPYTPVQLFVALPETSSCYRFLKTARFFLEPPGGVVERIIGGARPRVNTNHLPADLREKAIFLKS